MAVLTLLISLAGFVLSIVVLVVFFTMASNLSSIAKSNQEIKKLLELSIAGEIKDGMSIEEKAKRFDMQNKHVPSTGAGNG